MEKNQQLWNMFAVKYQLDEKQIEQFKQYYALLMEWNKKINLTALTKKAEVLDYHFADSLAVGDLYTIGSCTMIADVGTGGGMPGIPLKIRYPNIRVVLIEIVQKKREFLNLVIQKLGLEGIEVIGLDWRTFVRSTDYPIDTFCARASLRPDELVRAISSEKSAYSNSRIIYWASENWVCEKKAEKYLQEKKEYSVGSKTRYYALFKRS